jgi:hypothetical protein
MQINAVTLGSIRLNLGGNAQSSLFSEANLNCLLTVGGYAVASNQVNLLPGDGPQFVTAVLAVTVPWQRGLPIPIFMTANASVNANLTFTGSVEARADEISFVNESTQWWHSMASAVIFGLVPATALTLVVVPVICSLVETTSAGALKRAGLLILQAY